MPTMLLPVKTMLAVVNVTLLEHHRSEAFR